MNQKCRYDDVSQMVRDNSDKEFADSFEGLLAQRQLIKQLLVMRASKGLSQEDMATEMGCTQSRISKLESGADDNLRLGDLAAYLSVLGYWPQLLFVSKDVTLATQIKYHWAQTKELTEKLAKLANVDPAIAAGIAKFLGEACCNFLGVLLESAKTLPQAALNEVPLFQMIEFPGAEAQEDQPKLTTCARDKNGSHMTRA
jgi:transcriptional regulator with XRE-family HTH domain